MEDSISLRGHIGHPNIICSLLNLEWCLWNRGAHKRSLKRLCAKTREALDNAISSPVGSQKSRAPQIFGNFIPSTELPVSFLSQKLARTYYQCTTSTITTHSSSSLQHSKPRHASRHYWFQRDRNSRTLQIANGITIGNMHLSYSY